MSIPLRMFRLWAFTGMMAQVSALQLLPRFLTARAASAMATAAT